MRVGEWDFGYRGGARDLDTKEVLHWDFTVGLFWFGDVLVGAPVEGLLRLGGGRLSMEMGGFFLVK